MRIDIPGRGSLSLEHAVFDFNGTLAEDGRVSIQVSELLTDVSTRYRTHLVTADTLGTVRPFAQRMGIACHIVQTGDDKRQFVQGLTGGVVAVGNGANDGAMFAAAELAIGVIGPEAAALSALLAADVVVRTVGDALQLLLVPTRLVATLRT